MTTPKPEPTATTPESEPGSPDEATSFVGVASVPPRWVEEDQPEPPRVTPEELAGLRSAATEPVGVPGSPEVAAQGPSVLVGQYLFPTEQFRGEWRRHLIHLVPPAAASLAATAVLAVLAILAEPARVYIEQYANPAVVLAIAALLWLGTLAWAGWQFALWHHDRFILTNKRVMAVSGIVTRDVAMMPLQRVTDMKYEQSVLGRFLNYGTFVLESAGQDQALREIPHLPRPNELYLRVVEEMYDPSAVEARQS